MLDVITRQQYFKDLGLYHGEVDGIENDELRQVYADYQKAYFLQKSDWDGIYGTKTNRLLINHHNVWLYTKFDITDFRCGCNGLYCNGYPVLLDEDLIKYIGSIQKDFKPETIIKEAMRCSKYDKEKQDNENTKYKDGKAIHFQNARADILSRRKQIVNKYMLNEKANYSFCNGYYRTKDLGGYVHHPEMSSSIYIDVI